MIEVRPFKSEDLDQECIPLYFKEFVHFMNGKRGIGIQKNLTLTGFYNGEMVGFGGIQRFWQGVGEGWVLLTTTASKYTKSYSFQKDLLCLVRTSLFEMMKNFGFWRIQITVREDNQMALNFAKHLKFKLVARLEKYCSDKTDAFLFQFLKED